MSKFLDEIISTSNSGIYDNPGIAAKMEQIKENRNIVRDLAVLTSEGRRMGGTGDAKLVGELPFGVACAVWEFEPEALFDKTATHKFLERHPQFKAY